jgi:hypothetical protein
MKVNFEGEVINEFDGKDGSKYYSVLVDDGEKRKSVVNMRAIPGKKHELGKVIKVMATARVQFCNEV